ncbi:DUF4625 domain-containing protein [Flavobacterium sp. CBA20B-1]|uniref:DUF4625 domain-containing protein n=1 Tax=unclassified Flavobacterium TaxID=196869 RepID=UPI002224072E|nr:MULTISPECIES: DUF4625 domain-containing protein [unclassified Flavobacterium]WCM43398.1 DUF4625 domain-containing protein [Flavobacterium sp. CBA20B-1]
MKKLVSLSFALVSLIAISSCSDDDAMVDTTKPTVEILAPTDHQEVEPGSVLNIKANLADNVGLASYKIEIHSAEDGHEHKAKQLLATDFEYTSVQEVSGNATSHSVDHNVSIPTDVAEEHYHVGITVIDVNGNQNQQFVEVFIGHDHQH